MKYDVSASSVGQVDLSAKNVALEADSHFLIYIAEGQLFIVILMQLMHATWEDNSLYKNINR